MGTLNDACKKIADTGAAVFGHDRQRTVGSSEVGTCAKKVVYSKLGLVPDDDAVTGSTGYTARGNLLENYWSSLVFTEWCRSLGGELLYAGQSNQISLIGKGVPLSSTPDGVAVNMPRDCLAPWGVPDIGKSRCILIELKSIDSRVAKHSLPKPNHPVQVMAQLGLVRKATQHKPDFGVVAYVDCSDVFDIRVFPVKYDDKAFKSLVKRADWIMKTVNVDAVMPEGKIRGGTDCRTCAFAKQCLGFRPFVADDDPKAPTKATIAKIDAVARKVHEAEVAADIAKKQVLEAEADLYLALAETKRNFVKGKFVVHAKKTSPQQRLNQGLLKSNLEAAGLTAEQVTLLFDASKQETKGGTSLSVEVA